MPNVRSRRNPNGTTVYFLDYWDDSLGKRIRATVGTRKADAQKRASQIYSLNLKKWLGEEDKPLVDISIPDLFGAYLRFKRGRVKERTLGRYGIHVRHFTEFMHNFYPSIKTVREVKRQYIVDHLDALKNMNQAPKTLNAQLRFINGVFIFAVKEGYTSDNPVEGISRYEEPQIAEGVKFWTIEQIDMILNAVKPYYRDAYEFIYHTGLRKEELMYLTWDDIDIDSNNPQISIQSKEYAKGKYWTPKGKQRRIIPLNIRAVELLKLQQKSEENNWVFKAPSGGQIHPDRFLRVLKAGAESVGLTGNVHKLRHTFASHLVMKGVGIETVSKLLGHSSIEMTMKYAHLPPDHLRKAVEMLIIEK